VCCRRQGALRDESGWRSVWRIDVAQDLKKEETERVLFV
jgi:hypothetical protein